MCHTSHGSRRRAKGRLLTMRARAFQLRDEPESLRMTAEPDAKLIEQGRKLFAGDWQFFWAAPSIETLPPMAGLGVAFPGRSNVGKSSLINALTGRSALARTSHTAGRTQELIFFYINGRLMIVDITGDGT